MWKSKGKLQGDKKGRSIRTCFTKAALAPTNALFLFFNILLWMCHKLLVELVKLSPLL